MNTSERFRRWYEYEREMHRKVVASIEAVPEALRDSEGYTRAVALLLHLVTARRMWLNRLGAFPQHVGNLFPEAQTLDAVVALLDETEAVWTAYLDKLDDAAIAQTFAYKSLDAGRFENTIDEILTQLYGHSLYHRGQIAMLVRSLGCEPAVTDFIFWSRRPVD